MRRTAFTLVEVLVAVAVTAVLIGLVLSAVQKAREAAAVTASLNNIRQVGLGYHNMAGQSSGNLPGLVRSPVNAKLSVLSEVLPHIDQEPTYRALLAVTYPAIDFKAWRQISVATFRNPLDPTAAGPLPEPMRDWPEPPLTPISCYALNAEFFALDPNVDRVTDGLSQSIWLAEHYAYNCGGTVFSYQTNGSSAWHETAATFAHRVAWVRAEPGDYYPTVTGTPPQASAVGGKTFQVRPKVADCDPRLADATSSRGLQVGLADGSVRILAPGTSPALFWGMVTPAGGEVLPAE